MRRLLLFALAGPRRAAAHAEDKAGRKTTRRRQASPRCSTAKI